MSDLLTLILCCFLVWCMVAGSVIIAEVSRVIRRLDECLDAAEAEYKRFKAKTER